jgi:TusA-related sulfurtransferase
MSKLEISQRFDARGLSCPMPIVKTAQAMKTLAHGQFLEVLVVDRGPSSEFQVWRPRRLVSARSSSRRSERGPSCDSCRGGPVSSAGQLLKGPDD